MRLNSDSRVPIYRQIEDQVRLAIAAGRLKPGDQLPTVRALAVDLSVNPNTVIKAYTELERDGVVSSEQGTGTFVSAGGKSLPEHEREAKLRAMVTEFLSHAAAYGFTPGEVLREVGGHATEAESGAAGGKGS